MKSFFGISCIGLIILFGAFVQGQDSEPEAIATFAQPSQAITETEPAFPGRAPQVEDSPFASPAMVPARRVGNDLQKALRAFQSADSDDDKSDAKKKVKSELEKQYDAFLERDQARVDQLFDRLKKLEEQLERRKEAKDRLVDLKLEMLISQAEGLGWPSDNSGGIYRPSTVPTPFNEPAFYNPGPGPRGAIAPLEPGPSQFGLPGRLRGRK